MCKLIQVAIGCHDPQIWVMASSELTYSSSHWLHVWHTVSFVIDICLMWWHRVTRGITWISPLLNQLLSSVRRDYNADSAVQLLERVTSAWQLCCSSQLVTTDHTMTGFPAAAATLHRALWTWALEKIYEISKRLGHDQRAGDETCLHLLYSMAYINQTADVVKDQKAFHAEKYHKVSQRWRNIGQVVSMLSKKDIYISSPPST